MTQQETVQTLPEWCASVGLTLTAIPSNDPPHDPSWIADGWKITLTLDGRKLETDYWCGIRHREWIVLGNCSKLGEKAPYSKDYQPSKGWKKPRDAKELPHTIRPTVYNFENARFRPIPPTAADVLYSLISDASGVESGQSFEDWCNEFGSDPDSRKAEKSYKECQSIALRLRWFLGSLYDAAKLAAQDY